MASFMSRAGLSLFNRSTALSVKQAIPLRHAPNVKKKSKQLKDVKKKKQKIVIRKPTEIVPPTDPEAIPNQTLLEPARRRIVNKLSKEEEEKRVLLLKEWSRFKIQQHKEDLHRIQEMTRCREEALKELKKCSMYLYLEAIKIDKTLFPVEFTGPTETPPIAGYSAPDLDPDEKRN
jgi:large subunit ribosomal protein L40